MSKNEYHFCSFPRFSTKNEHIFRWEILFFFFFFLMRVDNYPFPSKHFSQWPYAVSDSLSPADSLFLIVHWKSQMFIFSSLEIFSSHIPFSTCTRTIGMKPQSFKGKPRWSCIILMVVRIVYKEKEKYFHGEPFVLSHGFHVLRKC